MWDIKLLYIEFIYLSNTFWFNTLFFVVDTLTPVLVFSLSLVNWQIGLSLPQNLSLFFGIKFCLCIAFLILIRGGTPRYRYDFLTKLGWLKFLSLILLVLIFSVFFFFVY